MNFSISFPHCTNIQCYVGHLHQWKMPPPLARRKRSTVSTPLCATNVRKASSKGTYPPLNATSMGHGTGPESSAQNVSFTVHFSEIHCSQPASIATVVSIWVLLFLLRNLSQGCAYGHYNFVLVSYNLLGLPLQGILGVVF